MKFIYQRCSAIVRAQRANYPYLEVTTLCKIVGSVMKKRREKVGIISDIQIAIHKYNILPQQQKAYRQAAKDFFNQDGEIVGNGSTYTLYRKLPGIRQLRLL